MNNIIQKYLILSFLIAVLYTRVALLPYDMHSVMRKVSDCTMIYIYTFSIKRQKDEKCLFSPTEFKTMLRHQFLLNFVHLNVGNSWKTYKTKLFDHLLLLNRIVGANITATVCCLFFSWKRQKRGARQYRTL